MTEGRRWAKVGRRVEPRDDVDGGVGRSLRGVPRAQLTAERQQHVARRGRSGSDRPTRAASRLRVAHPCPVRRDLGVGDVGGRTGRSPARGVRRRWSRGCRPAHDDVVGRDRAARPSGATGARVTGRSRARRRVPEGDRAAVSSRSRGGSARSTPRPSRTRVTLRWIARGAPAVGRARDGRREHDRRHDRHRARGVDRAAHRRQRRPPHRAHAPAGTRLAGRRHVEQRRDQQPRRARAARPRGAAPPRRSRGRRRAATDRGVRGGRRDRAGAPTATSDEHGGRLDGTVQRTARGALQGNHRKCTICLIRGVRQRVDRPDRRRRVVRAPFRHRCYVAPRTQHGERGTAWRLPT